MGGLNETDRLKKAGIIAKKATISRVALACCKVVTSGPTAHPRGKLPIDPELVEVIKVKGIPTDERRFKGRENGDEVEVIDGARRTAAGRIAEKWLQKHAPRVWPLEPPPGGYRDDADPGGLYVDCEIVIGADLEIILERLDANVTRGLPDSKSVLAAIVAQVVKLNKGEPDAALMARIVARMPRGVGPAEVSALARWDNLAPELQARLDDPGVPIGLLVPVVNARAEERDALLTKLLANGARTARGATRKTNGERAAKDPWARRMNPRTLVRVAERLTDRAAAGLNPDAFRWIAVGMSLAANKKGTLDTLPKKIADAIREARASKAVKV